MSKREKIITAIMIIAILFGLSEFLFRPHSDMNIMATKARLDELKNIITSSAMSLASDKPSDSEAYIIDIAAKEWKNNPFEKISQQKVETTAEITPLIADNKDKTNIPSFTLSGFLSMGEKKVAIINGLEYKTGDELESGGYIVKQIRSSEVILKSKNEEKIISIHLAD